MVDYPKPEDPAEVKEIYDSLRAILPAIPYPDLFVITSNIAMLSAVDKAEIIRLIKDFNQFDSKVDDFYREHDFIKITYKNVDYFLKFDWYGGQEGYRVVATLMEASAY